MLGNTPQHSKSCNAEMKGFAGFRPYDFFNPVKVLSVAHT